MNTFKLPDLGEGLQDAEVVEWKVSVGDKVKVDQVIVLVETAKAIVELPSPVDGVIGALLAAPGDVVNVGEALVEYKDAQVASGVFNHEELVDNSVSVVGQLNEAGEESVQESFIVGASSHSSTIEPRSKTGLTAPPDVIAFAKQLGMEKVLDDESYGNITKTDLAKLYEAKTSKDLDTADSGNDNNPIIKLSGNKRVMAQTMAKSHQLVPAVNLFDDAWIGHWAKSEDVTVRVLLAVINACKEVPLMNAWFDDETLSIQMFEDVNIGLAVNSQQGLFVPVIRRAQDFEGGTLRSLIDKLRQQVSARKIKPQKLMGATISVSNFGTLCGKYATPIIVPPQVAIVGIGKIFKKPVVKQDEIVAESILPLSLSFDHRAATGADAAKFLSAMIESLHK